MLSKNECLSYLKSEQNKLLDEYPKYSFVTDELFFKITDFMNCDYDGVSENKIYRLFLNMLKDIIRYSLNNAVSKAYMRNIFKKLNNRKVLEFLSDIMKSRSKDINNIMDRFVNFFVYWQNSDKSKDKKAEEIINLVDGWM